MYNMPRAAICMQGASARVIEFDHFHDTVREITSLLYLRRCPSSRNCARMALL